VKSRLAARLGPERAAAVYRALAEETIRRTAPAAGEYERVFAFAPPASRPGIEAWLPGRVLRPQCEGDLGTRMAQAFAEAFAGGAERVVLVGSDVPELSHEDIREAFASLAGHDVVLGPARDGGYYLIALARPLPDLFAGIPWSTDRVRVLTRTRAADLGLDVRELRTLADVDTAEDLAAGWTRLAPLLGAPLRAEVESLLFPSSA